MKHLGELIGVRGDKQRNPARGRAFLEGVFSRPRPPSRDPLPDFQLEDGNELAFRAVHAVSQQFAGSYNPLLLYGPPSSGKTHLLSSIAYRAQLQGGRVFWSSGRSFAHCFRRCQAESRLEDMRLEFVHTDVWVLDGYDSLCGKPATEREAAQVFDTLKDTKAQIVIAGHEHPSRLHGLRDTLKTRMLSGLDLPIAPLSPDGMARVLARKWPGRRQVSSHAFLPLVRKLGGDLRAALKLLPRLHNSLRDQRVSAAALRRLLGGELGKGLKPLDFAAVLEAVCDELEVGSEQLQGGSRRAVHSRARRVFFFLCWRLGLGQQRCIARQLSRSPSYVSNSLKKLKAEMRTDAELESLVRGLEGRLRQSASPT